jgi:ketosteroid isomerase-like protein
MKRFVSLLFAALFFTATTFSQEKKSALDSVVEAERLFAKTSVEKGIRDSFIEFFAEDGINFQPHPTNTREAFSKRPANRSPLILDWQPITADVSRAGDLGYTTGPYTLTDSKESKLIGQGYYFSLWKKQADGSWKVVLDCGIETNKPATETIFKAARPMKSKVFKAKVSLEIVRQELLKVDRQLAALANQVGVGKAYFSFVTRDARIHRNGRLPIIGAKAFRSLLAEKIYSMSSEPIKADVATSDDFGYTYGSYELQYEGSQEVEKGYYVRTWKRDARGNWKIVLETTTRLPKAEK